MCDSPPQKKKKEEKTMKKRKSGEPERRDAGPGRCLRGLYESHSEPVSFSAPHSSPCCRHLAMATRTDGWRGREGVCAKRRRRRNKKRSPEDGGGCCRNGIKSSAF